MNAQGFDKLIAKTLDDIRIELLDEFGRNFERKAFFATAWQRKKGNYRSDKPLLLDTGNLRRSIRGFTTKNSVVFSSNLAYSYIHNHGGEITVTKKMKSYFWYKYKEATGGFGFVKKENGESKKIELSSEANFYLSMALLKLGSKIKIPQRQFIGMAPEVEQAVRKIVEENLYHFVDNINFNTKAK